MPAWSGDLRCVCPRCPCAASPETPWFLAGSPARWCGSAAGAGTLRSPLGRRGSRQCCRAPPPTDAACALRKERRAKASKSEETEVRGRQIHSLKREDVGRSLSHPHDGDPVQAQPSDAVFAARGHWVQFQTIAFQSQANIQVLPNYVVPNDVGSLGKALHPTCLGGECPSTYCKLLWIRASAK